eukprot:Gb_22314 [translate_table: standard]
MTHERCNYIIFLYEPAVITLKEVEKFLSSNLIEIITIIVEDYVHASKGLTRVFTDAGLMKYMFPISKMPKNGKDWPTITDMVAHNQRLLVFNSNSSKEATEGIAYQWNYTMVMMEQYQDPVRTDDEFNVRQACKGLDDKLFLLSAKKDDEFNVRQACKVNPLTHSGGLLTQITGHQTTSNLLTWTVFLLAINPQWQTILREEVISVCGTDLPNADMLSRLKLDLPDVEGDRLYGIKLLSISLGRKRGFWTCIYTTRHVLYCYGGGSYFFICLDQRRNH